MYWLIFVSILTVAPVYSLRGNITKFSQMPNGTVVSGTMVTFNCQAIGNDVTWFVNGTRRDETYNDYYITIEPIVHFENWNITLSTRASMDKNNTQIQCYADGRIGNQADRRSGNITIAGPPQAPSVMLKVLDEGTVLNISWERPYSPTGFPIVSYNLTLHDVAANTSHFLLEDDTQTHFLMNRTGYDNCSLLNFTVTAKNSAGISEEGFAAGGFPVFPQTDGVIVQANVTIVSGIPTIVVEFQACTLEVCPYQDPANYTLDIVNENGAVVDSTGTKEALCNATIETFTTGIVASQSYTVRLVITQPHFNEQARNNIISVPEFGPPQAPSVMLKVLDEGTVLNISWERPYSPTGFHIVSYNLTLHDVAANTSHFLLEDDTQTHFLLNKTGYDNCSMLNFTVTAKNSVGISEEGFAAGGFPVFPQTDGVIMQADFITRSGIPTILVEFQTCILEVCPYQDPANYTLDIVNENGAVVDSTGTKEACTATIETFTTRIVTSQSYMVRLTITQRHFIKQALLNISVPKFGTDSGNHDLLIISMVSLGVALSVCVSLAITIVTACGCCYKRGRRPAISEHIIESPLQLAPPPKGKAHRVPTSLPTMQAVNPIYEGPLYDSPGGESFKLLLGSSSASTPSTPIGESCRYFDMPPSLPPPRKASVSTRPHPLSPIAAEESNDVKKGNPEYAEMKPLPCAVARPPDVPPALYEAMGGDYAILHK